MRIIINADDFGLNTSCTRAIIQCLRTGLITDTTLLANGEAFDEAVKYCRTEFPDKIGIHFNLTYGIPLTDKIKQLNAFCENEVFHGHINRMNRLNKAERQAVYEELSAQCRKVIASGIKITHADSHHHIHTGIFITPIVIRVCKENNIKSIRIHRNIGKIPYLKKILKSLYNLSISNTFKITDYMGSAEDIEHHNILNGTVEIMVHPDLDSSGNIIDRRSKNSPLLNSIRYWEHSERISYSQLICK